jgi:D-lactate dehydrogenase (cytochrome)
MEWGRCTEQDLRELEAIVGAEYVGTGASAIELASRDESYYRTKNLPQAVVTPASTQEVSAIMKLANAKRIPVTARGAGTSIEGNPVPLYGGIVLDMQRFDKIIEIRPEDFIVVVQPGVSYKDLNQALRRYSLFFPPDPGAAASIGGMIANNASGVRTVKYGATKDYVLKLTLVLANGDVIQTGNLASKSSSGYDLTRLFVGSEGTLGIVTQASLSLAGLPAHFSAGVATFDTIANAAQAVFEIIRWGFAPAALELMPTEVIALLNKDSDLGLAEEPTLFLEFHGASELALREELGPVKEICEDAGAISFQAGLGAEERNKLWEARYQAYEIIRRFHAGLAPFVGDIAVPISHYPEMVEFSVQVVRELEVIGYPFGHAGDGNLHIVYMGDADDEVAWGKVMQANEAIVNRSLELGGTATGEHGVGIGKRRFMKQEHGESLELMRQIKALLDPQGILNPGKIFP